MNILEAYIKKNKKITILLTGLDIDKINKIGTELSKDLKIDIIKINEIYKNDYLVNLEDLDKNLLMDKIKDKIKNNKAYILTNFSNVLPDINIDFYINIKFNSQEYIDKNIENSKKIYFKYKENIEKILPKKFFKYEDVDKTIDLIWDYLMKSIQFFVSKYDKDNNSSNIDNSNNSESTIEGNPDLYKSDKKEKYKKRNIFRTPSKEKIEIKSINEIYNSKKKKEVDWDKDNLYIDIDNHTDKMLKTKRYNDDIMYDYDADIYEEMNDSSFSPETKPFFYSTKNYYSNLVGGSNKRITGLRYL